jgi:hypothetical protein
MHPREETTKMRSEMEEIKGRSRPGLTFYTTDDPRGRSVPQIEEGGIDGHGVDVECGRNGPGQPRRVAAHLLLPVSSQGNSSEEKEGGSEANEVAVRD